jgi:DNA-binding GntR family transcriptional regulator
VIAKLEMVHDMPIFKPMRDFTITKTLENTSVADRVHEALSVSLARGDFMPGQKVKIREISSATGASMTPVRQALARLVQQGALTDDGGKSLRVPTMPVERWIEIRDMRIALETLAIRRAAARIDTEAVQRLRAISLALTAARERRDVSSDRTLIARFQLAAYEEADAPILMRSIRSLWVLTGPYLNWLFPDYVMSVPKDWRGRLCTMLEQHDEVGASVEIERDLRQSLNYIAARANRDGMLQPPPTSEET